MDGCPHLLSERESAAVTEGLCPVCLAIELARVRAETVFLGIQVKRLEAQVARLRCALEEKT